MQPSLTVRMRSHLVCSPCPKTPVEPAYPGLTDTHCCLRHWRLSRLPLDALTRLTGFTLSHYGSHTSLPTLKPNLTIAAPRLCTDCLPGFVGAGVSPTYTAHTELAHPQRGPLPPMRKDKIIRPVVCSVVKLFCGANSPRWWCYFAVRLGLKLRASGVLRP